MNYKTRLLGQRFGKLVVESFHSLAKGSKTSWLCRCDCGQTKVVRNDSLVQKTTTSCGCNANLKGNRSRAWKGYQLISGALWHRWQVDAAKRCLPFTISIQEAWELFENQQQRCALTGELLIFNRSKNDTCRTASLDRIDSSKGYCPGNVQWVHKDINFAKQAMSQNEFLSLCKRVVDYAVVA